MKWFNGRFDVERVAVPIACRQCDATGEALVDTYNSPVWPAPAVWCQLPDGWALMLLELPTTPQGLAQRIFARCQSCSPKPPAYLSVVPQLRFTRPPREHLCLEDLRAVVFQMAGIPQSVREHIEGCEHCRGLVERERAENPLCQLDGG